MVRVDAGEARWENAMTQADPERAIPPEPPVSAGPDQVSSRPSRAGRAGAALLVALGGFLGVATVWGLYVFATATGSEADIIILVPVFFGFAVLYLGAGVVAWRGSLWGLLLGGSLEVLTGISLLLQALTVPEGQVWDTALQAVFGGVGLSLIAGGAALLRAGRRRGRAGEAAKTPPAEPPLTRLPASGLIGTLLTVVRIYADHPRTIAGIAAVVFVPVLVVTWPAFGSIGYLVDGVAAVLTAGADRKSTRLNSSHIQKSRMPSSA